jgi:lipoprotein-anchoring transpeptidase ErfK/SrfK
MARCPVVLRQKEDPSVRRTILLTILMLAAVPAVAAPQAHGLTRDEVNAADLAEGKKATRSANTKAQVLLDRAGFSVGAIDGRESDNFENALRAFQKKNALGETGKLNKDTWAKLTQSTEPALIEYTISAADLKGPFAEAIPAKFADKAKLKRLDYTSAVEMLAERFHMDQAFFEQINRGKPLDKAGTAVLVANVSVKPVALAKAAKIEVDKGNGVVRVLAKDGALLASYPASIGSEEKPAPSGTLKIVRIVRNPTYTYDPSFKFKGVKAREKVTIAPGPNNPVGAVWIGLSEKSYGIHGTAEPSRVGKVDSHGCVRLTNWDAKRLSQLVKAGTPVQFQ